MAVTHREIEEGIRPAAMLRKMMESGKTVVAVSAHDAFSALLVERAGFDAVYVGSYITEAALLGKPDLALMSKTERLWIGRNTAKAVDIPVIVDAEEGYGNAVSVMDTIRDFEAAGIAGVHLDDEDIPSKCPFVPGIPHNKLISIDEMCGKIEAAVKARQDPNFVIIARSDVIGTMPRTQYYEENGMAEVVRRSNAYLDAGADAAFVMALNENELEYFAREINGPMVGIFAYAEPLSFAAFEKVGCVMTIGSIVSLYSAAKGMIKALEELKRTGDWNAITHHLITDKEFFDILKLDGYQSCYKEFRVK
ncbi:MAG: isocitrate lyase/PEP mutase family protein [Armatimonadetes bacterium]|nr:isocitrate lyase/PEP mutase family protein [Armatimonadota bacterium]